jgi:hypothetical protein
MNGMIAEENFFDRLEKDIKRNPDEDPMQRGQKADETSAVFKQDNARLSATVRK